MPVAMVVTRSSRRGILRRNSRTDRHTRNKQDERDVEELRRKGRARRVCGGGSRILCTKPDRIVSSNKPTSKRNDMSEGASERTRTGH